jgi:serine/threonine-protein kinase
MDIDAAQWPALSLLMDEMLDQPVAERAQWVSALTGEAAALAPQLLRMLQAGSDPRTTAWLDTLPKLVDDALHTLMDSGSPEEQAGDEVGPYRLERLLGRGGMGSVWYAERSDRLMRRGVALKLPQGRSHQMAARFERERDIVSSLVHPNIARLYDAGVAGSGQAYLALEYVEGQALDQYCDAHRMDVRARIALFAQVLGAVQYAHGRLVIHRDLKPSNILVTNDGEVRLLDFGVAKMLDVGVAEPTELTRLSDAGMTLAYASPEQVAGRAVTTATDVYSLGVVLFELLAGQRPYRLKRDSRASLEEAILQADIPLASTMVSADTKGEAAATARGTTVARLRKELRGDLDAILLKALSRKAQDRYETAAGFADDLERFLNGRAVRAHRRSGWYQARKFIGRNQFAVAMTCATVAALTAALGLALWQAREAARQAQMAARERDRALAAAAHREAVDEFMSDLLLQAGRTGKPISVSELVASADALSEREFADNPEARAAVLKTVGTFALELEGPDRALVDFDRARQMLENSLDTGLRAGVNCDRALLRGVMGHVDEAEKILDDMAQDPQTPGDARSGCLGNRAQLAIYRNDGASAFAAAEQALAQWATASRHSPNRKLELLTYRAEAQSLIGEPAKADASFIEILAALKELGRERGSLGYTVRNYRIRIAMDTGDPRRALALIDESIAILVHDVPDRPPPLLSLYQRSRVVDELGRHAEALDGYRKVAVASGPQDQVLAKRALLDSAAVLAQLGRRDEAERTYSRSVRVDQHDPSGQALVGGLDVARRMTRAKLDIHAHQFGSARANLGEAMRLNGVSSASLATMHQLRASADLGEGAIEEAITDARAALQLSERLRGDKSCSVRVGAAQLVLGQALLRAGLDADAEAAFKGANDQIVPCAGTDNPDARRARELWQQISGKPSPPRPDMAS